MLQELQASPMLFASFAAVIGLMVGSFLNVVIYRLPVMMERTWRADCRELLHPDDPAATAEVFNLAYPPSRCPGCETPIRAIDNIPVISWAVLGGRCRKCGQGIAARYPMVEALTGVAAFVVALHFGYSAAAAGALLLTFALLALAVIDYDTQYLPDSITLSGLWLGLAFNLWGVFVPLEAAVVGAMLGYLSLWSVYWLFKLATGKEGMGFGDFKLLAMLGAWLGWEMLPLIIILSSLVGAVVGVTLIATGRQDRSKPIPFGPYLAAAGWIALVWGGPIMKAYLGPGLTL